MWKKNRILSLYIISPRFIHNQTAAMKLPPIERALKTVILSVLAVYQQYYSITNQWRADNLCITYLMIAFGFSAHVRTNTNDRNCPRGGLHWLLFVWYQWTCQTTQCRCWMLMRYLRINLLAKTGRKIIRSSTIKSVRCRWRLIF